MKNARISRDALACAAMASMAADHFAASFLGPETVSYIFLRAFGRIAYPVFLTLFMDGCRRSGTAPAKRLAVLAVAALLAEPGFDMMVSGSLFDLSHQNVLWSWVLSLLFMTAMRGVTRETVGADLPQAVLCCGSLATACILLHVDYGFAHAACTIVAWKFSLTKDGRDYTRTVGIWTSAGTAFMWGTPCALLAILLLLAYDPGEPGRRFLPKGTSVWFYPAHLAVYALAGFAFG